MNMHIRKLRMNALSAAVAGACLMPLAGAEAAAGEEVTLTQHQRNVLADFKIADENRDGALDAEEFETFKERRDAQAMSATKHQESALELEQHGKAVDRASRKAQPDKLAASPHQKQTVAADTDAMTATGHQKEALELRRHREQVPKTAREAMKEKMPASPHQEMALRTVDYNDDELVTYIEAYYWETFERPSVFPPREESVPQQETGTYVTVGVGGHPEVKPTQRFGAEAIQKAVAAGGFDAVDSDDDGEVSIFEATGHSMMIWTENIYEFEAADVDGDLMLSESEYRTFRDAVRKQVESAERAGLFPPQQG